MDKVMINRGFTVHQNIKQNIKMVLWVFAMAWGLFGAKDVFAQALGQATFQQRCVACHHIGGGRLVGPDLMGVSDRRSEDWLLKFIQSPQAVVSAGDPTAKALLDEFKMMMPDQVLSHEEIKGVLAYIKEAGSAPAATLPPVAQALPFAPTPDEIVLGQRLFQGKTRFENLGPSCISCHSAHYGKAIGGGVLAKELTTVFSRLGEPGIRAMLSSPPFPVMQAAYKGLPFSESEMRAVIGFLQHVDKESELHQPREYGWVMFSAGVVGVALLAFFYSIVWRRRKRRSVNQDIYDRQIRSE